MAPETHPVMETERLIARLYRPEDADAVYAIYSNPEVWRWLGEYAPHTSVDQSLAWINRLLARAPEWDPLGVWAVVRRADDQLIGTVLVLPLEGGPDVEIGYHYGSDFWGHGYATEMARAALAYGFTNTDRDELVGVAFAENTASRGVLEKIGMKLLGEREHFGHPMMHYRVRRPEAD